MNYQPWLLIFFLFLQIIKADNFVKVQSVWENNLVIKIKSDCAKSSLYLINSKHWVKVAWDNSQTLNA